MKYLLSVIAVLSAPLLYGLICVPTIGVIMAANADLLNDSGGTDDVALLLLIEAVQAIVLLATGFLVAWIVTKEKITNCKEELLFIHIYTTV